MGRLIDADAFFDNLDAYSDKNKLQKMLDRQPTAYDVDKVVAEAYNKGLNDAWELAKKIVLDVSKGGIAERDMRSMFGEKWTVSDILKNYTPQEALAKLEAYEKEQAEIKVGDVVTIIGKPVVVTRVSEDKTKVDGFGIGGFAMTYKYDDCKKTGKHIDIQSVLKQIGDVE